MTHTAPSPESRGERGEADLGNLFRRTYQELHALAEAYMRQERPDHTLRPTALIHEAFLRLEPQGGLDWRSQWQTDKLWVADRHRAGALEPSLL